MVSFRRALIDRAAEPVTARGQLELVEHFDEVIMLRYQPL
jgi:hypothetical protein